MYTSSWKHAHACLTEALIYTILTSPVASVIIEPPCQHFVIWELGFLIVFLRLRILGIHVIRRHEQVCVLVVLHRARALGLSFPCRIRHRQSVGCAR